MEAERMVDTKVYRVEVMRDPDSPIVVVPHKPNHKLPYNNQHPTPPIKPITIREMRHLWSGRFHSMLMLEDGVIDAYACKDIQNYLRSRGNVTADLVSDRKGRLILTWEYCGGSFSLYAGGHYYRRVHLAPDLLQV